MEQNDIGIMNTYTHSTNNKQKEHQSKKKDRDLSPVSLNRWHANNDSPTMAQKKISPGNK
jgi:hypothetical protein